MDLRIVLGIIIVAAVLIYNKPFGSLWIVKKRCTATAEGHYVYPEVMYRTNGVGGGDSYLIPVYEYAVNDKLHLAMIEGMQQLYDVFPLNVEVKYNPSDPEVCFVNGKRGTIIGKK